ncbi:biliverdin-producing heme oxygenase [Ramlibacter rhizophilus]|uniref:Biliverdin-producing heme oxygenase n=1 Tax=Ramlibacter rhizophilus TaxID=1781167 RepID=A0A4Z0BHF3_9BURK|nr:biliverdin-producing heme oxygenase [Ramlibacter rhizophilus]TFY98745.1 biliverdin-producing heme oxygenase [Ramlibacter rhizophilus]
MTGAGPPSIDTLAALRAATAAQHRAIEAQLHLEQLDSRARLAATLQGFDAFLADWEPRVAAALPREDRDWFEAHRRGPWAAQDLQALGAPRLAPRAAPQIGLPCAASAFGSLYVLEGSALGGQVIGRHLRDTLGVTDTDGGRYFTGRGLHTGRLWKEFRERLQARVSTPADIERACHAARSTFEALGEALRETAR